MANPAAHVVIFDSADEAMGVLHAAFEQEGSRTVKARLSDIQSGFLDLVAFVKEHDPQVIVYDLPRPCEQHWNFLRLLRETDSLRERPWIVTTIDGAVLEAAVEASSAAGVVLSTADGVTEVVEAVRAALDSRGTRGDTRAR